MIRIPNPGSNIEIFIRIFRELHEELRGQGDFNLDDITHAMIARHNVTSQGAIGKEALRRSTRKDRSRDPLYNQSKMYAELYRTLGWIQSTRSALHFTFSFLGEHIATARDPNLLVRECFLGLAYPNEVLEIKGEQSIRIFSAILRTMDRLDDKISRDEMIVGPMSLDDDRNNLSFARMLEVISTCRRSKKTLQAAIKKMEKKRKITKTTMENYTRFPIAAIQWAGWAEKKRGYFHLTDSGKKEVARITTSEDIRLFDFRKFPPQVQPSFVRVAFYNMLGRSNFDLSPVKDQIDADAELLHTHGHLSNKSLLFSPFQQISRDDLNKAFPAWASEHNTELPSSLLNTHLVLSAGERPSFTTLFLELDSAMVTSDNESESLAREIRNIAASFDNKIDRVVSNFSNRFANANQDVFYPLIVALFRLLGFDCRKSRRGVNYERADAMIVDPLGSIPIEIKSPGEELEISVKGVRQALENKVVLLSRKNYPANPQTTSLVVGFNPPNERSEVHELIADIDKAFDVRIGIIDFRSLLCLAVSAVVFGKKVRLSEIYTMKGVVRVSRASSKH